MILKDFSTTLVITIPTKNTLAVKKSCGQDLKSCYKKDVKSKGGGQGLCRNAVDHINIVAPGGHHY